MQIGTLGEVVFSVSDSVVETITSFTWSGSARYSTHQRHLTHALTEFTGLDPDGITFDIFVSAYLGVDPMTEVVKIWNYERSGTAVPLTIGTHAYGKYRWSIKSHKMKAQTFDKRGTSRAPPFRSPSRSTFRGCGMTYKVSAVDIGTVKLNEQDTVSSVLQNIAILLSTRQGTVPLYREFGLPMRFLDKPTHIARPMIVSEVKEAIEKFEPRATFIRVLFDEDASIPGRVIPTVEVEINE